jgi:hypothetical protein
MSVRRGMVKTIVGLVVLALCGIAVLTMGTPTGGGEDSVVQNHIEQRFMNPDATVVFNKAELAKAIHEEADA